MDIFFFQNNDVNRFRFFTFVHPYHQAPSPALTALHQQSIYPSFLPQLPVEITTFVQSFLSADDLFHLCISKIFFRQHSTQPWFYSLIQHLLTHLLIHVDFKRSSLFSQGLIIPVVLSNHIYFALDMQKAHYLMKPPCISVSWTAGFETVKQLLWLPTYNSTTTTTTTNEHKFPCDCQCLCSFYNHVNTDDFSCHIPFVLGCLYCNIHFSIPPHIAEWFNTMLHIFILAPPMTGEKN